MTRTRDAVAQSSWLPWLSWGAASTPFAIDGTPFGTFGFARGDTLERSRRAISDLMPAANSIDVADNELTRSLQLRLQDVHQSERRRGARASAANGGTTAVETVRVAGKTFKRGQGDRLWLHLESHGKSYRKWARRNPEEARLVGRPRRVYRMIRKVRRGFQRAHSPLAKYARHFVTAGYLSGYDPRFIAAFAAQESAWGRATPRNAPYNFWGWSVYTGNQSSAVTNPFKSPGRAFRYYGRQLRKNYGGARSVYSAIWAPYAADPNHERIIGSILKHYFHGTPRNIRFAAAMQGRA
jgi:hypothetical protein